MIILILQDRISLVTNKAAHPVKISGESTAFLPLKTFTQLIDPSSLFGFVHAGASID